MKPQSVNSALDTELHLTPLHWWAARDKFLAYASLCVVAAFVLGLVVSRLSGPARSPYEVNTNIGPPPIVEPFVLKNVDKQAAKIANDAMVLTTDAVPAAPAFLFRGATADFERATDCLAATIFYEAGAEPTAGQMAVVQVVLNRARHPAYPKSVCGVVFQGQERRTGCQFSFTCDGSMQRRPSTQAWVRYQGIAQAMLKGLVYPPVGLATHYHTDWVLPAWSARLDKVRVEGTHLFFRYHGFWGTPAAYRGRLSSTEASFTKLAMLSPAHKSAALPGDDAQAAIEAAEAELKDAPAAPDLERVATTLDTPEQRKEVFLIYVDPLLDSAALTAMAEKACNRKPTCKVFAWADQGLMPRGLPFEPAERSSMAYSYIRTPSLAGKGSKQKWNCALFPRDRKTECL